VTNLKRIKLALIKNDLTVTDLAAALGMHKTECSKMIHGHRPFYAYRERAAELLGVPLLDIFPDGLVDNRRRRSAS